MALREILASFGFQIDDKKLDAADAKVSSVTSSIKAAFGVWAGGQVLGAVKSFVGEMQATADQLIDTSAALGVNAQELQRWQLAAKLSGAEATDLATGLRNISKVANDSKGSAQIKALGIDLKDAGGNAKNATQLLGDVGLELAKIKSPTERTAKALEFFGKSGAKLMPIFADGEEGLSKLLDRLDELGGGLGEDALEVLEKSGDATDEMNVAILSLKSRLAVELFPAMTRGLGTLTRWIGALVGSTKGTKLFQAAIVVLGSIAAAAGAKALLPWLPFIAAITAAVLVVDDLITLFEGGDSAIGRLIDQIFGAGTASEWVKKAKTWWADLWREIDRAPTATAKVKAAFDALAPAVEEALSVVGAKIVEKVIQWGDDATSPSNATTGKIFDALVGGFTPLPIALSLKAHAGFEAFKQAVIDKGREVVDSARRVGEDIVRGVTDGIRALANDPIAAIGDLGKSVIEKLRNVFRSNSPSKETFEIGGPDLVGSLATGMATYAPRAVDEAESIGRDVLAALSPTMRLSPSRAAGLSSGGGSTSIKIDQTNRNEIRIEGNGPASMRDDVRSGVMQANENAREALINALEPVAPSPV